MYLGLGPGGGAMQPWLKSLSATDRATVERRLCLASTTGEYKMSYGGNVIALKVTGDREEEVWQALLTRQHDCHSQIKVEVPSQGDPDKTAWRIMCSIQSIDDTERQVLHVEKFLDESINQKEYVDYLILHAREATAIPYAAGGRPCNVDEDNHTDEYPAERTLYRPAGQFRFFCN